MTDAELADRLLADMRTRDGLSAAAYAEAPRRLTGGFDAAIFAFRLSGVPAPFDGPLVLRLLRPQAVPERVAREAAIQNALAACGFPAPRVFVVENDTARLGGTYLVMELMPGRTLGSAFEGLFASGAREALRQLAQFPRIRRDVLRRWDEAQRRLHDVHVASFLGHVRDAGIDPDTLSFEAYLLTMRSEMVRLRLDNLIPLLDWLESNRPRETAPRVVCHGDLQPFNVLAEGDRITAVIDWVKTVVADPALDYGAILAILATAPLGAPKLLMPLMRYFMKGLARAHTRAFRAAHGETGLRYYQVFNCTTQLFEVSRKRAQGDTTGVYNSTAGMTSLKRHIEGIVGIKVDVR